MTTILVLSAALVVACNLTAHRSTHRRVRDIAAVLATGLAGVCGVAIAGLLFGHTPTVSFALAFVFGAGVEWRAIRRREAERRQLLAMHEVATQLDKLIRSIKGAS